MLTKPTTHYEALEISPDASLHEVREAYLRLKNAYNKDSIALYSLVSTEEREDILARVEAAYQILSDDELRKEYDKCHEQLDSGALADRDWLTVPQAQEIAGTGASAVVSIDRVPPMENNEEADSLLIPPVTDRPNLEPASRLATTAGSFGFSDSLGRPEPAPAPASNARSFAYEKIAREPVERPSLDAATTAQIEEEKEWRGETLRRFRDSRMISIDELSSATKISKNYLTAIETDDYGKLPAAVFTRGFLIQICRLVKLPQERVLTAYMERFNKARG